jgi:hypothetical protein
VLGGIGDGAVFGWFKKKPTSPSSSAVGTAAPEFAASDSTTSIDKTDFALGLPFKWREVACDNGFEFQNEALPEQCIVDVQHAQKSLSEPEMQSALERLAMVRRDATIQLSGGAANLSQIEYRHGNGQIEARFQGVDKANQVQIATAIRATPTKFITMSLYRYTLSEVGIPFSVYASTIFDLAHIKAA